MISILLFDFCERDDFGNYYGVDGDKPLDIAGIGTLPIKIEEDKTIGVTAYYAPGQDATILSAGQFWIELGITLSEGYNYLKLGKRQIPVMIIQHRLKRKRIIPQVKKKIH